MRRHIALYLMMMWMTLPVLAGPFAPAAGVEGSTAVSMSDSAFQAWATGWTDLIYGNRVTSTFQTPDNALGPATGVSSDIVSLGGGGRITLTFASPITNQAGWDFAVFENGYSDIFLELAFVEVSSNGTDFIRFDSYSLTENPVSEFGTLDTTNVTGFAGKFRISYGTSFDLSDLALQAAVINGTVDLSAITHVRIIDIEGDGSIDDTGSNPVYDPYPTNNSAGFDLEAVGVRYESSGAANSAPGAPVPGSPLDASVNVTLSPTLELDSTWDADDDDIHLLTRWQVATEATFQSANTLLDVYSSRNLTSLFIPELILGSGTTYHWRALVMDGPGAASGWSAVYSFSTTPTASSTTTEFRDWDNDGSDDTDIPSFSSTNSDGESLFIGIRAESNIDEITAIRAYLTDDFSTSNSSERPDGFPSGIFGLKLKLTNSAVPATITVYLSEAVDQDAWWYSYDTHHGWTLDPHAEFNSARDRVTITLVDGSDKAGDADGSENGYIIFAGGPGIDSSVTSQPVPESSDKAGIGDKGGCFISTIDSDIAMNRGIAILATLLVGLMCTLIANNGLSGKKEKKKEVADGMQ